MRQITTSTPRISLYEGYKINIKSDQDQSEKLIHSGGESPIKEK